MKRTSSLCFVLLTLQVIPVVYAQEGAPVTTAPGTTATPPTAGGDAAQRNMLDLLNRVEQLQKEVRQLRGQIEVLTHENDSIKKRQRELYLDMDRRLREVELGAARVPSATQDNKAAHVTPKVDTKSASNKTPAVSPRTTPPTPEEKTAYHRAFNLLKEGRYDQSISAFETFLKQHPGSTYADNAQYWLGEANYVSRKYRNAVTEFNKVLSSYADSPKVPDAMLKLGFTHYELKEWDKARKILEEVVQKYPKSSAARLAKTRLQRMQKEGR